MTSGIVIQHLLDFGNQTFLDAVQEQALQLNHPVAMTASVFLDPVAHSILPVLYALLQCLANERALHRHVALHIERQTINTDKLFQKFKER